MLIRGISNKNTLHSKQTKNMNNSRCEANLRSDATLHRIRTNILEIAVSKILNLSVNKEVSRFLTARILIFVPYIDSVGFRLQISCASF